MTNEELIGMLQRHPKDAIVTILDQFGIEQEIEWVSEPFVCSLGLNKNKMIISLDMDTSEED